MGLPWYANVGFVVAFVVIFIYLWRLLRANSPVRRAEAAEARQIALRLAGTRYLVQGGQGIFGAVTLELKTADAARQACELTFGARHPDVDQARQLQRFDRIGFRFSEKPLPRVGRGEVCAYLRLMT